LLTACSALALAACGGDSPNVEERSNPGPPIERGTAEQLASRSEEVARLLEGGDNCTAMAEAGRLRDELNAAIERGVIPEIYLEDLSGIVNEIQVQIPVCDTDVAQVPPPPRGDGGRGEKRGKDKEKKKDEDKKKDEKKGKNKDEGDD
jgi:hypothetical protein